MPLFFKHIYMWMHFMHLYAFIGHEMGGLIFDLRSVVNMFTRNKSISEDLESKTLHDRNSFFLSDASQKYWPQLRPFSLSLGNKIAKPQKSSIFKWRGLVGIHGDTLLETNISLSKAVLKMSFLFPRWDMLIPYMEGILSREKIWLEVEAGNTHRNFWEIHGSSKA